jgi:hypothetical protein
MRPRTPQSRIDVKLTPITPYIIPRRILEGVLKGYRLMVKGSERRQSKWPFDEPEQLIADDPAQTIPERERRRGLSMRIEMNVAQFIEMLRNIRVSVNRVGRTIRIVIEVEFNG